MHFGCSYYLIGISLIFWWLCLGSRALLHPFLLLMCTKWGQRSWSLRVTILLSNNESKFEIVKMIIIKTLLHQTLGFGLTPDSNMAQILGPGNRILFLGEINLRWNLNCSAMHKNREYWCTSSRFKRSRVVLTLLEGDSSAARRIRAEFNLHA